MARLGRAYAARPLITRAVAAVAGGVSVTPATATLTTATFAPTVLTPVLVTPGIATLTLTAFAPSLPRLFTPATATLTTATFAPVVTTPRLVTPGVASLVTATFAPTVNTGANVSVVPATASLALTTFIPAVLTPRLVTPATASLVLAAFAPAVTLGVVVTLDVGVVTGDTNDDGYMGDAGDPTQYLSDSSDYFGWRFGAVHYNAAWRFRGVTVPPGATILYARLRLNIQRTNTAALLIKGEAADNPGNFTGTNIAGRTRTSASVAATMSAASANVDSPDIKSIIQEIVNRGGWASGNALVIFADSNGTSDYSQAVDYTGSAAFSGKLHIEYVGAIPITPATASLTLTSFAPTVNTGANQSVTPAVGSLVLSAFAPTVLTPSLVTPGTVALATAVFVPLVLTPRVAVPPVAALAISSFAPVVTATANQFVTPGVGSLTLAPFAPTVLAPRVVVPGAASFIITTFVPSVGAGGNVVVTPATLAVVLLSFAPSVGLVHRYLAYYYHAYPTRGYTQADFERDIVEAQAIGIDGFLLGYHDWVSTGVNYISQVANMFAAAAALGTGFKLALAPIGPTINAESDVTTPFNLYYNHANYLTINGSPLLVPYGGGGQTEAFWISAKAACTVPPFLAPYYGDPGEDPPVDGPSFAQLDNEYGPGWRNVASFAEGLTHFASVGDPTEALAVQEAFVDVARKYGDQPIAGFFPSFWKGRLGTTGRVYFEMHGGEGIAAQFAGLRDHNVEYSVLTSWNDFTEGIVSIVPVAERLPTTGNTDALQLPSDGTYWLTKYHVAWSRTGIQPAMDDSVYGFHRVHPNLATPADATDPPIKHGTIEDSIYVTTHLITSGNIHYNDGSAIPVAAGIVNTRIPWTAGTTQNIKVRRGGVIVLEANGVEIDATPAVYNYFIASFYAGPNGVTRITPGTRALVTATFAPTVTAIANQLVTPGTASLVLSPSNPTVTTGGNVAATPATASLTLSTFAPTVTAPRLVTPGAASLVLTTFAPSALTPRLVTPTQASLSFTTFAPTVLVPLALTPSTASLTLTTFVPTVTAGANVSVTPATASLTLVTFAPVLPRVLTPGTASLVTTRFAPTVLTPVLVTPSTAVLVLTTFAPTVTNPQTFVPITAVLVITRFAPSALVAGAIPPAIVLSAVLNGVGVYSVNLNGVGVYAQALNGVGIYSEVLDGG